MDLHLIGEGRHEQLWQVLGARVRDGGPRSRSGRRTRAGSGSSATSTTGTAARTRCGRWAAPGSGSCSSPALAPGPGTSTRSAAPDGRWRTKADPMAAAAEAPPATASVVVRVSQYEWADQDWMAARARRDVADQPDEHLRGAHRLVAAGPVLRRARRSAHRLRQRTGLHARRVPAGHGASVRRLLGLPGHVVLRADGPFRHSGRLPVPGRPAAPGRHRRLPRLGARALPARRLGAGQVRRDAAVRARRPAAAASTRTGAR